MIIMLIDPCIAGGVAAGRGTVHARQTIASKVIVMDAARSGARVFRTPADVRRNDMDETTPQDDNTSIRPPSFNSPVIIGGGTTVSLTRTGIQEIVIPKGPPVL